MFDGCVIEKVLSGGTLMKLMEIKVPNVKSIIVLQQVKRQIVMKTGTAQYVDLA